MYVPLECTDAFVIGFATAQSGWLSYESSSVEAAKIAIEEINAGGGLLGRQIKVVEADTAPSTFVGQGRMRFLKPEGGTEPVGNRIITVPQDVERARSRDPHSGFTAYVPKGSVAKGKALVESDWETAMGRIVERSRELLDGPGGWGRFGFYTSGQLFLGITGTQAGVAHFAHLGGMAIGFVLIQYWRGKLPVRPRRVLMR